MRYKIAIILAIVLVTSPLLIRLADDSPTIPYGESYFNLRIAEQVHSDPLLEEDVLQGRPYNFNLYHYFLALFFFLGLEEFIILSSVILSLLSAFLFYVSLKKLGSSTETSLISFYVYILSPFFVFTGTTLTPYSLSIFLITLSLYLYADSIKYQNEFKSFIALVPGSLTVLTNPAIFVMFFLSMLMLAKYTQKDFKPHIGMFILGLIFAFVLYLTVNYMPVVKLGGGLDFKHYVTDFGAVIAYPFFTLLLALITIIFFWNNVSRKFLDVLLFIFVLLSTILPESRLVLNLILCLYAGIAIKYFMKRKWAIPVLRDLTLLLLISSLLFSSISFVDRVSEMEPLPETLKSLEIIKENKRPGAVLSTPENGFIIQYYAGKPSFLDLKSVHYSDYKERIDAYEELLESRSPRQSKRLLNQNSITYIFLDEKMQENKGILLVLKVSENFIKLVQLNDKEAWLYIRV